MSKRIRKADIGIAAPLLVFAVLTVCVLAVLLSGADIYQKANRRDQRAYDHRTIAQYISTRVRQSDVTTACFIGDFDATEPQQQGSTFFYLEGDGDERVCTRIYCYDGYLYELYAVTDEEFFPEDGEPILPLKDLQFSFANDMLCAQLEYDDGTREALFFTLRTDTEVRL